MSDTTNETRLTDDERAKFAGLVAKIWNDPELAARYDENPRTVLAEHGVVLAEGVPMPAIPERPEGDISIEELESVGAAGGALSSIGSVSCPSATFSTISPS
jgi:putative thiazole/oxazole-modified microcin (TOMM)-like peptide